MPEAMEPKYPCMPAAIGYPFDQVRYYAFVLDALARFGSEGAQIKAYRWPAALRKWKPLWRVLSAVAKETRQQQQWQAPASILEFGVYKARSTRMLARLFPECAVYGFDTFSGFPDDGRTDWALDFAIAKLPAAPANVEFIVGRFEDTLAPFLQRNGIAPIRLIHIDCDIFSATTTVLEALAPHIGSGTVIVFDELLNYDEFAENELLSLYLFLQANNLDFEWFVTIGHIYPFERACAGHQPTGAFVGYRNLGCYQNAAIILRPASDFDSRVAKFMPTARNLARQRPLRQPLLGVSC